jgi:hypothetical protein
MKKLAFVIAPLLAAAPALAQPGGWPPPADDPNDTPDPLADQPPPIVQPQEPPPDPVVVQPPPPEEEKPMEQAAPAEPAADRPVDFSVGIGIGYDFPADVAQPNVTSVRFRLPSGLTVEPFAALALGSQSEEAGGVEASTSSFGFEVGADVRLPNRVRGPVDLVLVGGAGLGTASTNPDGDDNDSSTFFLDVHWGLGLDFWFRRHWCFSLTATNPFLVYQQSTQESGGVGDTSSSRFDIGAIWEPNVVAALHLFL